MLTKSLLAGLAGLAFTLSAGASWAADVTLKLHQMLPPQATIPSKVLEPWAQKVQAESGGRIAVELYPAMQLGGKPADLVDQVKDGVVDLTWTLFGYTPGRFPKSEAFELPFMVTTAEATSVAFQDYYEKHLKDELTDYHVLAVHTHGPGLIHTIASKPVKSLEDMKGLKLRGTSKVVNQMLEAMGASAIGMPVTAVPESLSKSVIDGSVVPWEVTPAIKIAELAPNHTAFSGPNGLYTGTFVFAMNKDSYDALPDDLKKVIDDNSGQELARLFGKAMDEGDIRGKDIAEKAGNTIITLDEAETARWKAAGEAVTKAWIAEMDGKGMDGTGLYNDALALIQQYSK
ncbi:TRAP transporter substrate-binding protein [Ciceribacter sp. L1K23]|uniref:TRAP transporter substrate-binding protein n=1 Tax=unclassified Ciceribacter TaxID=2628820 RepID=UPI001ABE59B1|nr:MULTISPECIES: TRAP transporter substrate-binding protein [unclassified Ciceribacter]MBO3759238.1 TRAP transporter substrate-binding protein [Ciceribacter sp. L1K22]MBR0556614.1 TRAP transporter substrate-binding protein [Ciceribacter sp. L1K23]